MKTLTPVEDLPTEDLALATAAAVYVGTPSKPHQWLAVVMVQKPTQRYTLWTGGIHTSPLKAQEEAEPHVRELFA